VTHRDEHRAAVQRSIYAFILLVESTGTEESLKQAAL
jgi:hypothetical protein